MIASFRFSKTRQIDHLSHFWLTFVHWKCKRSSLRSQCWMRLFLWFSNTVLILSFLDQYFCIQLIVVTLQFFSLTSPFIILLRIIDIIQSNLNSLDLKSPFSLCVLVVNYDCTYCVCEQIQKSLLHKKFSHLLFLTVSSEAIAVLGVAVMLSKTLSRL